VKLYAILFIIFFILGAVLGYYIHPDCHQSPIKNQTITVIKEKTQEGVIKETVVTENKEIPPAPIPISRYTVGVTTDFNGLGALFTYRPFKSIPISIGGYVIPKQSYGLAITFNF